MKSVGASAYDESGRPYSDPRAALDPSVLIQPSSRRNSYDVRHKCHVVDWLDDGVQRFGPRYPLHTHPFS